MATLHGKVGTVFNNTNAVGEVTAFEYSETADTAEDSVMGDTVKSYKAGLRDGSGSVTCRFDPDDTQQNAMDPGTTITLKLRPEGTGTGLDEWSGSVIVTGKSVSVSFDGIEELKLDFQGVLTQGNQA